MERAEENCIANQDSLRLDSISEILLLNNKDLSPNDLKAMRVVSKKILSSVNKTFSVGKVHPSEFFPEYEEINDVKSWQTTYEIDTYKGGKNMTHYTLTGMMATARFEDFEIYLITKENGIPLKEPYRLICPKIMHIIVSSRSVSSIKIVINIMNINLSIMLPGLSGQPDLETILKRVILKEVNPIVMSINPKKNLPLDLKDISRPDPRFIVLNNLLTMALKHHYKDDISHDEIYQYTMEWLKTKNGFYVNDASIEPSLVKFLAARFRRKDYFFVSLASLLSTHSFKANVWKGYYLWMNEEIKKLTDSAEIENHKKSLEAISRNIKNEVYMSKDKNEESPGIEKEFNKTFKKMEISSTSYVRRVNRVEIKELPDRLDFRSLETDELSKRS